MKRPQTPSKNSVGRLAEWCKRPSPPYALAVGSTCGCEMARLEREICDHLNHRQRRRDGQYGAFDCEDIRCYAGHPRVREFIVEAADLVGESDEKWNDYELVLRGLASIGGVVLGGQAALDATKDFDHVFRVVLSRGGRFDSDGLTSCWNPDRCGPEDCMVAMIADSFLDWVASPERMPLEARKRLLVPEFEKMDFSDRGELEAVWERSGDRRLEGMLSRSWR